MSNRSVVPSLQSMEKRLMKDNSVVRKMPGVEMNVVEFVRVGIDIDVRQ